MAARSELRTIDIGRSVTYEGWIAGYWSIDSLTFEPGAEGTCITFHNRSRPQRWLRLRTPLFDVAFKPQARRAVEGAKRLLEGAGTD